MDRASLTWALSTITQCEYAIHYVIGSMFVDGIRQQGSNRLERGDDGVRAPRVRKVGEGTAETVR